VIIQLLFVKIYDVSTASRPNVMIQQLSECVIIQELFVLMRNDSTAILPNGQ
jgi:hypothetical protein